MNTCARSGSRKDINGWNTSEVTVMDSIVVTGMGWATALGSNMDRVWSRLLEGRSGIEELPSDLKLKNQKAAYIADPTPLSYKQKLLSLTDTALLNTLNDSNFQDGKFQRKYLVIGTSLGYRLDSIDHFDESLDQWLADVAIPPGFTPILLSTACSSGSDAILVGQELIRSGMADYCLCGGSDILGPSKRLAHTALGTMSATNLKAFDQGHDGTILGEGAGLVALEVEGRAGVTPLARLRGCGSANDAAGLTAPDENGEGIRLAIERSLSDAGMRVPDIDLISAHGSGTFTNDRVESEALTNVFAQTHPIVCATKGAFGHTLGATGALEAIALINSLHKGMVPPIANMTRPMDLPRLRLSLGDPINNTISVGLSLTIGFGGFNTSLIFSRF